MYSVRNIWTFNLFMVTKHFLLSLVHYKGKVQLITNTSAYLEKNRLFGYTKILNLKFFSFYKD